MRLFSRMVGTRIRLALAAGLLCAAPLMEALADIRLGAVTEARKFPDVSIDSTLMVNTRAKILNPINFGPDSLRVAQAVRISVANTITPELLDGSDIFFIGQFPSDTFSPEEIELLDGFVRAGKTLILVCDGKDQDQVCEHFGHAVGDVNSSEEPLIPTVAGLEHPLFNGPWPIGAVDSPALEGQIASFTNTSDSTVTTLATAKVIVDSKVVVFDVVLEKSLPDGDGRIIMLGNLGVIGFFRLSDDDRDIFTPDGVIADDNSNDKFLGNLIALGAGAEQPPPMVAEVPNFACRTVKYATRLDPRPASLDIDDIFGLTENAKLSARPEVLCNPVLADGTPSDAPSLTCFEVRKHHERRDDDDDHHHARSPFKGKFGIEVNNEFGLQTLIVGRTELLCVTSLVDVIPVEEAKEVIRSDRRSEHRRRKRDDDDRERDDDDDDEKDDD